jgi:hypothetical protein
MLNFKSTVISRALAFISIILIFLITLQFALLSWRYAVNLPVWDDFDSVLYFLNRYVDAVDWRDKFHLIFEQHNEHRIVINKLLTLACVILFDEINLSYLIYCSTTALILLALILGAQAKKEAIYTTIISVAILLQPQYGDGLNWVTTSVASFFLTLMALISSLLAHQSKIKYHYLIPILSLSCFSLGNGITLPFCIMLTLLLNSRWRDALIVFITSLILCSLYFMGFKPPQQSGSITDYTTNFSQVLDYGFNIVGASIGFADKAQSIFCGILLTLLFFLILLNPKLRQSSPLIAFLFFLFCSAGINTAARSINHYVFPMTPGRYTILSSAIVATLTVILYQYLLSKKYRIRFLAIPIALVFNLHSYQFSRLAVENLYDRTIDDLSHFLLTGVGLTYPWPDRSLGIYQEAIQKKLYHLPIKEMHFQDIATIDTSSFIKRKGVARGFVNIAAVGKDYVVVAGWAILKSCTSSETTPYVHLVGNKSSITIAALKKPRSDIETRFTTIEHHSAGYYTIFPKSWLVENGPYQVEILLKCGDIKHRYLTRHQVAREPL